LLTTENQPVFTIAPACPVSPNPIDLNWLFVQWSETERLGLTDTYLVGTANYSRTNGVVVTGQYDIDGSPYYLGWHTMPGSCNPANGVYAASGDAALDIDGKVFFNASGMGVFKTQTGRATFFFPRAMIVPATHFGGKTFHGQNFD